MLLSEFRHQLPYVLNEKADLGGKEPSKSSSTMEYLPDTASIARVRTKGQGTGMDLGGNGDTRHLSFDSFLLDHQHDDKTFLELGLFSANGLWKQ